MERGERIVGHGALVAVTGASSLLATHVIEQLLAKGYCVRALLRNVKAYHGPEEVELREVAFDNVHALKQALQGCSVVIHIAAVTQQNIPSYRPYEEVNVEGTVLVAEVAISCGVYRMVYISSANTCGYGTVAEPGHEGLAMRYPLTKSYYAESKQEAEVRLMPYASKIDIIIVHPSFMLGKYDSKPSSGRILQMYIGKRWLTIPCGGKNFVCASDVANGVILAMERGKNSEHYLLTGENLTYRTFLKKMIAITGQHSTFIMVPQWLFLVAGRVGDLFRMLKISTDLSTGNMKALCIGEYHSCEKARRELGYTTRPIEEGIKEAIDWMKAHGLL